MCHIKKHDAERSLRWQKQTVPIAATCLEMLHVASDEGKLESLPISERSKQWEPNK
jgi:hypothetical protein